MSSIKVYLQSDSWLSIVVGSCVFVCVCVMISFCVSLCVSTAGLDIGPLAVSSPVAPQSQSGRRTPRTLQDEPLDGILSPELDKMVTDGQCLRRNIHIYCLEV